MKGSMKRCASLALAVLMGISLIPANQMQVQAATPTVVVRNQKELNKALKSSKTKKIKISTGKKVSIVIPEGDYSKLTLVLDAGKASVVNKGTFDEVAINKAVAFTEKAKKNDIVVTDSKLQLVIGKDAKQAKVDLKKNNAKIDLKVNGTVSKVKVEKKTNLSITGSSKKVVPVTTTAKNSSIKTYVPVAVSANAATQIQLKNGAANSSISAKADVSIKADKKAAIKFVVMNKKDAKLILDSDAEVKEIKIKKPAKVNLSGDGSAKIAVESSAEGTTVKTDMQVEVITEAEIDLTLEEGAKDSSVTVTKEDVEVTVDNKTGEEVVVNKPDQTSQEETVTDNTNNQTQEEKETEKKDEKKDDNKDDKKDDDSKRKDDKKEEVQKPVVKTDLSYAGYALKWEDDFNGDKLDLNSWNVETHDPGWVNAELQSYENSTDNIYVKDGKLVLKPIKTGSGKDATYTSGRVNTQGKHDFTYGLFECVAKVPTGKGFLPAFWMMPTDENLYGQWPRCGEIDIMEVMGQETSKLYGTIHYGNPHAQSQGTYEQIENDFASEYHKFSCEWVPGKITWYVDGIKFHEENDWYSATVGQGEVTYPAPFDQPFYMILNLAVGGSWVGYPDEDTDINSQAYMIDSVKVYQKTAGYDDSNVTKPVKEVVIRDADASGNYVVNGDFSKAEKLDGTENWQFLQALEGVGTASIANNEIKIETTNAGTADYSIQLVQPNIPAEQGGEYKVTFDAYADEARTMKVDVSAPDRGYNRYLNDTVVELGKEKKTYAYTYTMSDKNDANARLEFNLGNTDSTATVYISNVKLKKIDQKEISDAKVVLADGNCVYNGSFQEGNNHLGYWDVTIADSKNATAKVTDLSDGRRLKVTSTGCSSVEDVKIEQKDLAFVANNSYEFSFTAQGKEATTVSGVVAGEEFSFDITTEKQTYTKKFKTGAEVASKDFAMFLGTNTTVYIDDICVVEDAMIKNGSFNAGFAGFDPYIDGSASASYVVDSQHEDNAADFTIKDSGDQNWKIQLKQSGVSLEQGKWYKLSFDIKSSMNRSIQYAIQRDGNKHNNDWTPYVQENVNLIAYGDAGEYKHVENVFQMKLATDTESIFNIAMGAEKEGQAITEQHRICIDNIVLEETEEPEIVIPVGENMITNGNFSEGEDHLSNWTKSFCKSGEAEVKAENNQVSFDIKNVGTEDYSVQLKQGKFTLEKGASYTFRCKLTSTEARIVKYSFMNGKYDWFGGQDVSLGKDEEKVIEYTFIPLDDKFAVGATKDDDCGLAFSMGQIFVNDSKVDTPASTITISNVSLVKNNKEMIKNGNFSEGEDHLSGWEKATCESGDAEINAENNKVSVEIKKLGTKDYSVQLKQGKFTLEKGASYTFRCKMTSTESRDVKYSFMNGKYDWFGGQDVSLEKDTEKVIEYTFTPLDEMFGEGITMDNDCGLAISMGKIDDTTPVSTITISDVSLVKN